jgi:hypothetical protein
VQFLLATCMQFCWTVAAKLGRRRKNHVRSPHVLRESNLWW